MNDKLKQLENFLEGQARVSNFSQIDLSIYPENFRQIHAYNLFGNNLLAVPASLIIDGDSDEFERPFNFTDDIETLNIFESEFRAEIPNEFIQIGNLYGLSEIVLLNKLNETIHIFHVSDICDTEWLSYKLKNSICEIETFIENLRPQTVCCLIDPKDSSEYEILEIRNNKTLITEEFEKDFKNTEDAWIEYWKIVNKSINKGFEIHYAPKKVFAKLNDKSTNGQQGL